MRIIDKQRDGLLPLSNQITQHPLPLLRLRRYFEVLLNGKVIEQCIDQDRQAQLTLLHRKRFGHQDLFILGKGVLNAPERRRFAATHDP